MVAAAAAAAAAAVDYLLISLVAYPLENISFMTGSLLRISSDGTHCVGGRCARDDTVRLRRRMDNELNFSPNFERLVLGCIDADFASKYSLESS